MPFSTIQQFEKSFPAIKNLSPEQKKKCLEIFNAIKRENPKMDDGMAIATAIKNAKELMSEGEGAKNTCCDNCVVCASEGDNKCCADCNNCLACKKEMMNDKAKDVFHYLSFVGTPGEKVTTLEVLRVGVIRDRDWKITKKMLEEYVQNFKDNVYGTEIQVNLEHKRGSEAAGWVKDLYLEDDKLMAKVEWTELGMEKISKKLFKFVSAELAGEYPHHTTGKLVGNVFIGLALTNTPALKGQEALALSEQIENLINKDENMFKKLLQSLKERQVVSKEDKALMHSMLEELPAEEQKEVAPEVSEVDAKPEVAEKTQEEKDAEDAAKKAAAAGNENLAEKLLEVNKSNAELKEKLAKIELKEVAVKSYMLSTDRSIGIQEVDLSEVVNFLASLNDEQKTAFASVFSKIKSVDFSVRGTGKTQEQLSEEAKMVEADKEAKELAEKTGKSLSDCLAEVYKAKGIV